MEERFANQRGMTLVEIMIAVAIIGVGLTALAQVIPLAAYGIHEGNHLSTATFLANQRLEQMRNARWEEGGPACVVVSGANKNWADQLGVSAPATASPVGSCPGVAATFPDENPLPSPYNAYSRTARVTSCAGVPCNGDLRQVTVTVTYRPMAAGIGLSAPASKAVAVSMYVAKR